jgi:5S rRNA maturation endonuclease (ribonuclease M5)
MINTTDTEFLSALEKLSSSNKSIVVEGRKDKAALQQLGINNTIFTINKPLFALAEEIAATTNDIIILTDLDKKGRELYGRLSTLLQRLGVRIDNQYREFLFRKTKVRQIEGLSHSSFF